MGKQMQKNIFAGATCDQLIYNIPDRVRNGNTYDPERPIKDRFEDEDAYRKFKENISRRNHVRSVNANFSPSSLYSTLTFDDESEVHTFAEAKIVRRRFLRVLKQAYPNAVIFLYMGRGKSTNRIHFHMLSEGIPEEFISKKWKYGRIKRIEHLREHCFYDGVDHGQDYTGIANYLFDHWTEEVGGHRWSQSKNARKPDKEEPTEVNVEGGYSGKHLPEAPEGYKLVEIVATKYGYYCFHYVVKPQKYKRKKRIKNTGPETG